MQFHFNPDKNPDGDHILFLNAKSKQDRIKQDYCILGNTNEDGYNSKRHVYDTKCDEARKLWREQ